MNPTTDFNSYYGSSNGFYEYKKLKKGGESINFGHTNVSVNNCIFRECQTGSSGGAICCSANTIRLLIEDTSFFSCTATGQYGGAVWCNAENSILHKICSFDCSSKSTSNSFGQSFYLKLYYNEVSFNNIFDESSIYSSGTSSSNQRNTLYMQQGNIIINGDNITSNSCGSNTALYCSPSYDSAYISYSSIVNNTAKGFGCMELYGQQEIRSCNILKNDQSTASPQSTIYADSNIFIWTSCILDNNKGKIVFYEQSKEKRIYLNECTFDNDIISGSRYTNRLTIAKKSKKSFIHGLAHLKTIMCEASFDSVGALTATAEGKLLNQGICATNIQKKNSATSEVLNAVKYLLINAFLPSDPSSGYFFGRVPRE